MDAADGFSEEWGDSNDLDFGANGLRNGIGGDDFFNGRVANPLVGEISEDGVGDTGVNAFCTVFMENFRGRSQCSCGFRHVVHQQDIATFDLADDVHRLDAGGADAMFGDDGEFRAQGV
jgi:hypothetical protein